MVPPWIPSFASPSDTLSARGEVSELAEGARLEIACVPKRCVEGSNPPSPPRGDYVPATADTYAATSVICCSVSVPANGGMAPPPFVTCSSTTS